MGVVDRVYITFDLEPHQNKQQRLVNCYNLLWAAKAVALSPGGVHLGRGTYCRDLRFTHGFCAFLCFVNKMSHHLCAMISMPFWPVSTASCIYFVWCEKERGKFGEGVLQPGRQCCTAFQIRA